MQVQVASVTYARRKLISSKMLLRTGRWRHVVPLKYARAGLSLAVMDQSLVVVGGRCYYDSIAHSEFASTERAKARANLSYKPQRLKEHPDCIEVFDIRKWDQWDQIQLPVPPPGQRLQGLDRTAAACAVY